MRVVRIRTVDRAAKRVPGRWALRARAALVAARVAAPTCEHIGVHGLALAICERHGVDATACALRGYSASCSRRPLGFPRHES